MIDFQQLKIDALVVSALPNVRYLTGFTGSNGLVILWPGGSILFTDPRYTIQAASEAACTVKIVRQHLPLEAARFIKRKQWKRIGFEKTRLTFEGYQTLKDELPMGASLKPVAAAIEALRAIKSLEEIEKIRRSVVLNSRAFEATAKRVKAGVSESEVAAELEYQMRRRGAQHPAFETIVAAGERTALPHAQPTGRKLANNELLLIDMGASLDGYASDMTRMLFMGRPGTQVRSMYRAVLEAQLAAIDSVREGVTAQNVDRAARRVLKEHGLDKAFVHSTGHGLGLEIHEPPRIGKKDETPLKAGMAITIEPGAYLEGTGGIRIEDTVVVTENGCEVLTPTPKELMLL
ncbi:MAG: Xaa-Pro peptidase family protein [Acidobacteriota bacterium]|nr:Xaa-Pro peptidase family protein [Acidobacteriota bacterium]